MQYLKRILAKWLQDWLVPPRVIHYPETLYNGGLTQKDWETLRTDMAKAYDQHPAFFKALHLILRKEEKAASMPIDFTLPNVNPSEAVIKWNHENERRAYQADILRFIIRLPIKATEELARSQEKTKKEESTEQSMSL